MKTLIKKLQRKKLFILLLVLFIPTSFCLLIAQQNNFYFDYSRSDKVEMFPDGQINWTKNYILAKVTAEVSLIQQNDYSYFESVINKTEEKALEKLFGILRNIKVDDYRKIADVFKKRDEVAKQLSIIFKKSAKILEPIFITNTKFEVTAKISIYGANSLSSVLYELFIVDNDLMNRFDTSTSVRNTEYNKIIIDIRDMGFNTAIFPRIFYLDDKNNDGISEKYLLYGPEVITEDIRKESYYIRYINDSFYFKDEIWVKYKEDYYNKLKLAYFTSALKIDGELMTDIIISKADANRFFTKKSNLETFLSGNIYLLTD